jgi:hypothetical protein
MLADPPAGLRKPPTDLLFLQHPDSGAGWGPALSGSVRLALANTGRLRLSVLNTCRGSRLVAADGATGHQCHFASTFLAPTGSLAVAGSLAAVGRRVTEGFHDPPLGDVVLTIETAGVGA